MGGYKEAPKNIREVSFDVAVAVSETSGGGGKAGIKVLGLGEVGAEGQKGAANSKVSRIAFTVPIAPPIIFIDEERQPDALACLPPRPVV